MFSHETIRDFIDETWEQSILPALHHYVAIPAQSPAFDPAWQESGHIDAAVALAVAWIEQQQLAEVEIEVIRIPGRTPLLFLEIPGQSSETVLLYGHLDKQPPLEPWAPGLGPWQPVIRDGRLYGRGAADDGYAVFASVAAIRALQREGLPHARCVVVIECCEESGSYDLPHYVDVLRGRIGEPQLVVCLDSGCGDYERLWLTTSLRGVVTGDLRVSTLTEGVHSGKASGIVPSSFRIARALLERVEDGASGEIRLPQLHCDIPPQRIRQVQAAAAALGAGVHAEFPFQPGCIAVSDKLDTLLLNRTWRPQLEITGAAGLPPLETAGNVLRPETTLKLSMRLPPRVDAEAAAAQLKAVLEKAPPYGAAVEFVAEGFAASGWEAPPLADWLEQSLRVASRTFFGHDACAIGEGGTIPFMGMLGEMFPQAQFVITGVLGPHSNAHGPNEFLDIATAKRLTACIARVVHDHYGHTRGEA